MTDEITINIREVQHFMYCPRRFALLNINRDWNENAFVVKANLMHENVHNGKHRFSSSKKVARSSIEIYNDLPEYNLFGITDCIEFVKSKDGIEICGLKGKYDVQIVEYKPTAPKNAIFDETDAIQVFAQKVCADYVWKCDSKSFLYYKDINKRVQLPFDTEYQKYDDILKKYLKDMRSIIDRHEIPPKRKGQKCSGCSISDICFSKTKKYSVRKIITSMKGKDIL